MKFVVCNDFREIKVRTLSRRISKKRSFSLCKCGFDIETTNLIQRDETGTVISAKSVMYHWQFCIDEYVILGRTWEKLKEFFNWIDKKVKHNLIIWVANLGFEMSFLMAHFEIKKCFAKNAWQPMYFKILNRLEFHDCLQVTGGNLKFLAKNYCSPDNQKLSGDLDFKKIRNYGTPLTEQETKYCVNDVTILSEFAGYIFEKFNDIPITQTGILRKELKYEFEKLSEKSQSYIKNLMPEETEYHKIMRWLFQGGYTHANFLKLSTKFSGVAGLDIVSSYPAVMLHEYYPVTRFKETEIKTDGKKITDERMNTECLYFTICFSGIKAKHCHTILSEHKIMESVKAVYDNGRLYKASLIKIMCTEIDYKIIDMFYKWKHIEVHNAFTAKRGKLPDYLTSMIKKYYILKNQLKEQGKKDTLEYMIAKSKLNSFYGMTVTRLVTTDLIFDNEKKIFQEEKTSKPWFRITKNVCLSPYWGIYVTAHARYKLLKLIHEITLNSDGFSDCIYSDTDSVYLTNYQKHKPIIDKINAEIRVKNITLGKYFDTLGTFDLEKENIDFKTLGAKRYMTYSHDIYDATIAGVDGQRYIQSIPEKENPFDYFDFNKTCVLDIDVSGKKAHHYFFTPEETVIVDDGQTKCEMECFSGCAIYDVSFGLKFSDVWLRMIEHFCTYHGIHTQKEETCNNV